MKKSIRIISFLFVLSSILFLSSFSKEQIRFQKIDMLSGLSYNSVLCVIQDHNQFLWIGTKDGLNKYNSLDNEIYKYDINDSLSLSNSQINCIYETRSNDVWVGTAKGLNKYERGNNKFRRYDLAKDSTGLTNGYIKCISQDSLGFLWIGTANGLNRYDPVNDCFEHFYLAEHPTDLNNIIALLHDREDRLWIGTRGGLYLMRGEFYKRIDLDLNYTVPMLFEIRDIKQGKSGELWIGTENHGVYSTVISKGEVLSRKVFDVENSGLVSNSVRKILVDGDQIWLATLKGLVKLEGDKITNIKYSIEQPEGISNSSIHDIIKDHLGGYWVATYTGGLNYYHPQNNLFPHIKSIIGKENSLKSGVITSFIEDEEENLWISTGSNGLSYWNTKTNNYINFVSGGINDISDNIIKSMSADKDGNLWIGTYDGLNFFNRKTKTFTKFFHDPDNPNSLNYNQVHAVRVDKNGLVWIGMNGGEFQMFDPVTKKFTTVPGIGKFANALFEDSKGHLWIGVQFGLRCIDTKTKQLIDISHTIQNVKEKLNYITWITEDKSGKLWIGTQASGLIVIDFERAYWFNKENGLNDNTINAVLEDEDGFYWVSTNKGISKLNLVENNDSTAYIVSTNFTTAHGLQGPQFETGSALKTKQGNLLFGGINGFNLVKPQSVEKLNYFPKVVLSDFKVLGESESLSNHNLAKEKLINGSDTLQLKFNERNIYLRFAGINFIDPSSTYYRYKLGGSDKNWIDLEHLRSINYTYLPVGKHELHIKASSNNNVWGEEYRSLEIVVLPPWWQTWWAYVIYVIIILILLYIFFHYSQKWAYLKNSLSMEHFKREKEFELHESKLRFFTDVSHELRTPLTLILAPLERIMIKKGIDDELNGQLQVIRRNGNRMMQLINQVLNLRRLETGHDKLQAAQGDFVIFLKEISLAFNEIANSRDIIFKFSPELDSLPLWFDRNKMESVIGNLLSNAFKYTEKGGFVELILRVKKSNSNKSFPLFKDGDQFAEILISNVGKGISKDEIKYIFDRFYREEAGKYSEAKGTGVGLELTRRMVQMHHGEITVESEEQSGDEMGHTTFFVRLPIGKTHLTEDEIINDFKDSETLSLYTQELQMREKLCSVELTKSDDILPKLSGNDKQTLLIVEDNDEVRHFISELFADNYVVEEAGDGAIGWTKATGIIPDLIVSDIMMPRMNGIELCHKLKTDVRTSHIPVILLTARTTIKYRNEGIETGADEYITKPFSAEFLILRVKNLIQQRELLRNYFARQAILKPKDITVTSVDERLLEKAVDFITANIENPSINVETMSKELGLSRVHFYRKIRALTNFTAVEFIRNIRLKRAALLLQKNKLSIKEVQNMVGFESADYFRKCFKAQYEMTPSEYALKYRD